MSTKIIGNQIDQVTRAIIEALQVTEQINLPALNQSQVTALGTPAYGTLVYNSTEDMAQIYKQDAAQGVPGWDDVGGGGDVAYCCFLLDDGTPVCFGCCCCGDGGGVGRAAVAFFFLLLSTSFWWWLSLSSIP